MRAAGSVSGTSTVSDVSSMRERGKALAGTPSLDGGVAAAGAAAGELVAAPRSLAASLARSLAKLDGGVPEPAEDWGAAGLTVKAAPCIGAASVPGLEERGSAAAPDRSVCA